MSSWSTDLSEPSIGISNAKSENEAALETGSSLNSSCGSEQLNFVRRTKIVKQDGKCIVRVDKCFFQVFFF